MSEQKTVIIPRWLLENNQVIPEGKFEADKLTVRGKAGSNASGRNMKFVGAEGVGFELERDMFFMPTSKIEVVG